MTNRTGALPVKRAPLEHLAADNLPNQIPRLRTRASRTSSATSNEDLELRTHDRRRTEQTAVSAAQTVHWTSTSRGAQAHRARWAKTDSKVLLGEVS